MRSEVIEFNPCIAVLAGPPYSGKTTLGLELSHRTNLQFVDINPGRWLFPAEGVEYESPFLRSIAMTETYALAHFRAAEHLAAGKPVLLAATYSHGSYVNMLRGFADLHRRTITHSQEALLKIFVLQAPEKSLPERSESRMKMHDQKYFPYIPLEVAMDLRRRYVPIVGDDVVNVNTGLSVDQNVSQIIAELDVFSR